MAVKYRHQRLEPGTFKPKINCSDSPAFAAEQFCATKETWKNPGGTNSERISFKLKGMSPVQYRTHSKAI